MLIAITAPGLGTSWRIKTCLGLMDQGKTSGHQLFQPVINPGNALGHNHYC